MKNQSYTKTIGHLFPILLITLMSSSTLIFAQEHKPAEVHKQKQTAPPADSLSQTRSEIAEAGILLIDQQCNLADSLRCILSTLLPSPPSSGSPDGATDATDCSKIKIQISQITHANDSIRRIRSVQDTLHTLKVVSLKSKLYRRKELLRMWLIETAEYHKSKWDSIPLSKVNLSEVELLQEEYTSLAQTDSAMAVVRDALTSLQEDTRLYHRAIEIIHRPYNQDSVKAVTDSTKPLLKRLETTPKYPEVNDLTYQLVYYSDGLTGFQDVIKSVDKAVRESTTHQESLDKFEAAIAEYEKKGTINLIKTIPWLKEQYNLYYEALTKDPKSKSSVRDLIMSINVSEKDE